MRATLLHWDIILTKACRAAVSIMAKKVYLGLTNASEVFHTFTTHLYSCLCNYNAIFVIY